MRNTTVQGGPGHDVDNRNVSFPPTTPMEGKHTSLVPLSPSHSRSIFAHLGGPDNAAAWTFIPIGPLLDQDSCDGLITTWSASRDPQYFAITNSQGDALGVLSYLNIAPDHRKLEIGWVILGSGLRRTRMATEAFYLVLRRAFEELGYQRVEWKADSLNQASRSAADRLGFQFEGVFRKHLVVKGRRRDTAWFSIIDDEWPSVKAGLESWLDDANFDIEGRQKRGLKECREATLK